MDVQKAVLSKALHDEDFVVLVDARITPEFFPDPTYCRVFEYMLKHWQDYGTAPDLPVVQKAFPSQDWPVHRQPMGYFISQLQKRRAMTILTDALNQAALVISNEEETDPEKTIENTLASALARVRIEVSSSYDTDITQRGYEIAQRLAQRRENPGYLRGISTGFKGIDYVTGGLQPEHLVTITGTPKSFKSATLLYMAWQAHRQGERPLFLGFEMSTVEQEDRLVSLMSGIGLTKIMTGDLSDREEAAAVRAVDMRKSMQSFVLSSDITSATTVSGVQAKIQQYQPAVVFIDGVYLMDPEGPFDKGSSFALTDITRSLKRLAQQQRIPVVITTQSLLARSKSGLSLHSIGYTSSFGQDSDLVLGTERLNEENMQPIVKFHVIASRSGPRQETFLQWDWAHGRVDEIDTYTPASQAGSTGFSMDMGD